MVVRIMSDAELSKLEVLRDVEVERLPVRSAAGVLGLSERQIWRLLNTIERVITDKGYRGHNAPPDYKFRVFIAGQKLRMTPKIKREMRRRSAVEPVIGHLKAEHRMDRNYLAHRAGDAANAVLAAAGYNFRLLIRWLRFLLCRMLCDLVADLQLEIA